MITMTSRERVLATLAGRMPDRVPWIENYISDKVAAGLRGSAEAPLKFSQNVRVPPDLRRYIPLDNLSYDFSPNRFVTTITSGDQDIIVDGLIKTKDDLKLLDQLPDPDDESLYRPAQAFLDEYRDDSACIAVVRTGISNTYLSMGIEHFSTALIQEAGLVSEIMNRFCAWSARVAKNVHELPFDLFLIPDDLGFTNAPMMSLAHFREFCLPLMRRLIGSLRRPAIYHSDGNIHVLLEDIVNLGVAGIANIEPGPMDIERVKREFGDKITLIGNVDLHYTLTLGTPEETKEEVKHLIRVIGKGGRYILASANSLPDYVRSENVRAMGETLLEHGFYAELQDRDEQEESPQQDRAAAPAVVRVPEADSVVQPQQEAFRTIQNDVFAGNSVEIGQHLLSLLDQGHQAEEIMTDGLVAAMNVIGER